LLVFGIAHASKAVIPRDSKGQWAERIDTVVNGPQNETIIVTAYQTPASNSADFNRYNLVSRHSAFICFVFLPFRTIHISRLF
jgi:hypothetical protein